MKRVGDTPMEDMMNNRHKILQYLTLRRQPALHSGSVNNQKKTPH